ncbi:hypothetical protein ACEWY4_015179 [Coilia grayii]|uniref:Large ribosomal subunit protein uL18m n=1 Tax=Coilia grayii TaxID=363190 RepID=A0ABD1JM95_9TELE
MSTICEVSRNLRLIFSQIHPCKHMGGMVTLQMQNYSVRSFSQAAAKSQPEFDDNEAVNKAFVNRNPRNLEQMAIAIKDRGWATVWPSREFYHRLYFSRTQHHISAEVYTKDSTEPVITCSTREWAIKRELSSTRSVAACQVVGEVLAQRCREAGITRMVFREIPWKFRCEGALTFWTALKKGGVTLSEPRRKYI